MFGAAKISQGRDASWSYACERGAAAAVWGELGAPHSAAATRVMACLYVDIYISYHFPPTTGINPRGTR